MAFEQEFNESMFHFGFDEDTPLQQKWKSMPATTSASENVNECFDCNICLDSAHEPVVSFCGHLYCWPCIYEWLQVQSSSLESNEQPKCPVCKANISNSTLIPLYGRGASSSDAEAERPPRDLVIPARPHVTAPTSATTQANPHLPPNPIQQQVDLYHHQQFFRQAFGSYATMVPSSFGDTTMTGFYSPTVLMFGELVSARIFGNGGNLFAYPYPNSYLDSGIGSPRIRRQEMKVDKSLGRVSIFFLCCIVLCLLLF